MGKKPKTRGSKRTQAATPDTTVLDTVDTGSPFIPAGVGEGLSGAAAGRPPAPEGDLVVEVELAPNANAIGSALAANTAGYLADTAGAAPSDVAMRGVLRQYGLREARPVFTGAQVQAEQARLDALRAASASSASAEQASALERLPPLSSFLRLHFPPGTPPSEVMTALKRLPEVNKAVIVPKAAPPMLALSEPVPIDPQIGEGPLQPDPATGLESQWYLHRTRVPEAWQYSRGANVIVADIDWGFRTSHQEFSAAIDRTYNAVDGGADVTQGSHAAHGTAVLGIAGARADGVGMAGYAPEAMLWAVQGDSGPSPPVFEEPWAEAIDFVRRTVTPNRRKVVIVEIQTVLGGNFEQIPSVHRAIRAAIADGCVVCVAAGNGNRPADRTDSNEPFDPTGSILVGATAFDATSNKRAFFSNYGSRVVVSAPGDLNHDLTCGHASDSSYRNGFGGTSGATPKVAGTVALMLSVNPDLTHGDVRDILSGTGSTLVEDPGKPIGTFLNAEAAVAEALRRRSLGQPGEALRTPAGLKVAEPPRTKQVHGINRRQSQLVLPKNTGGPISWETVAETPIVADAASGEHLPAGDKTLRSFRESVEGTLTQQDRILIVGQAIQMLDNFYVHRPLKEAIHAVRPIQRLRVLQRRLLQESNIPAGEQDELAFHNTLTQVFNSVRDLHTNYQLPRPYRDYIAYLPFEVAPFYENGVRRYLVTRVLTGHQFAAPEFGPGSELFYWNGMAIERAVRANADQTAGSNDAARHARGVSSLTIRPMNTALPPDADFVDIEFLPRGGDPQDLSKRQQMRQQWLVRYSPTTSAGSDKAAVSSPPAQIQPQSPQPTPEAVSFAANSSVDFSRHSVARSKSIIFDQPAAMVAPPEAPQLAAAAVAPATVSRNLALAAVLGLDTSADAVREARQIIFDSEALRNLQSANFGDEVAGAGFFASASPESLHENQTGQEISVRAPWNVAFRARTIDIGGVTYGHIQIRTFYVEDPDGFVAEFIRLLASTPASGLILDVRGNGGGSIPAAERVLQTLTPTRIEPERLQFVVTPGTLDLSRNNPAGSQIPLDQWRPSLEEAVETGALYSHAFPLTDPASANAIGQRYYGPVVLVVDGNCYSATDMFAAGFQDHRVGKILGIATNTGAGGANVWEHWLLNLVLPTGWGLRPLPNEASMRVAIRQCLRVGPRAGALLEDFGVVPDEVHRPTRADVMDGDRELLARAAELLSKEPRREIGVAIGPADPAQPGFRLVTINTVGLTRLDFYVEDRPEGNVNLNPDAAGKATLTLPMKAGSNIHLAGFIGPDDPVAVAVHRGQVA
ncbi:S8 family serine peptidase [Mesorhizobium onobrychidis]|uniref:S8 family serine peptidase n=1 Tax=Mesorhizobium onobrychidis TaxID=2775404 RepID=A0ABY5R9N6_9HYPH|nr:S8 family serine peptidase [Mesorhizobium onobrychidis]UVC19352.1 S8 family serine peptidase [Mesorhizobium onobrychidis]